MATRYKVKRKRRAKFRPAETIGNSSELLNGQGFAPKPAGGGGLKPVSSAAKPLTPQARPFDATYEQQLGLNNRQLATDQGNQAYQRQQIGARTGYTDTGAADLTDPYNQAKLLVRSYQQGQRGTFNQNAQAGQMYSGANARQLQEGTFQYNRADDALKRSAMDAYQQNTASGAQSRFSFDQANIDAFADSLERAPRASDPGPQPKIPASLSQQLSALGRGSPETRTELAKRFGVINPDGSINVAKFDQVSRAQRRNTRRKKRNR